MPVRTRPAWAPFAVVLVALLLVPAFAAAQGPPAPPAGRPMVDAALFVPSAPFASVDERGRVLGITPDFLQLIGIREGFDAEFLPKTSTAAVAEALVSGAADVAAVARTPENEARFDFSKPYAWTAIVLWVKANASLPADMAGRSIVIISGSAGAGLVNASFPAASPRSVGNISAGIAAVERGEADAFLAGVPPVASALRDARITDIKPFGQPVAVIPVHFAVRKGDAELLATLDRGLAAIPADERRAVYLKWAGADLSEPQAQRPAPLLSDEARWLVGGAVALLAFVAGWALLLRQQVRARTRALGEANEELRREAHEKARLAAIVEGSDDAIVSLDLAGIVQSWNRGAEGLWGHPAQQAVGKHFADLVGGHQNLNVTMRQRIAKGERIEPYESEVQRRDGSRLMVNITMAPLRGPDGVVTGASVVAREVSQGTAGKSAPASAKRA